MEKRNMLLTLDIGNTNIKAALFNGEEMVHYWRLSTQRTYTSDEMGVIITNLFAHENIDIRAVKGIMMSSVVPTVNFTVEHMCRDYFGMDPIVVAPGIKTGIDIKYENPRELGSDRICNAVAAYHLYGGPCVFIDFGTATTLGALDKNGAFLGGCICPGIKLTSAALVSGTAKLPHFELTMPEKVIGKTTLDKVVGVNLRLYTRKETLAFKVTPKRHARKRGVILPVHNLNAVGGGGLHDLNITAFFGEYGHILALTLDVFGISVRLVKGSP